MDAHSCVCVFSLRRSSFKSRSFIAFCPLSFYGTPVKSYVTIPHNVCLCSGAFLEINFRVQRVERLLCVLYLVADTPRESPTKLFDHMHQRVAMKTSRLIKISGLNTGLRDLQLLGSYIPEKL